MFNYRHFSTLTMVLSTISLLLSGCSPSPDPVTITPPDPSSSTPHPYQLQAQLLTGPHQDNSTTSQLRVEYTLTQQGKHTLLHIKPLNIFIGNGADMADAAPGIATILNHDITMELDLKQGAIHHQSEGVPQLKNAWDRLYAQQTPRYAHPTHALFPSMVLPKSLTFPQQQNEPLDWPLGDHALSFKVVQALPERLILSGVNAPHSRYQLSQAVTMTIDRKTGWIQSMAIASAQLNKKYQRFAEHQYQLLTLTPVPRPRFQLAPQQDLTAESSKVQEVQAQPKQHTPTFYELDEHLGTPLNKEQALPSPVGGFSASSYGDIWLSYKSDAKVLNSGDWQLSQITAHDKTQQPMNIQWLDRPVRSEDDPYTLYDELLPQGNVDEVTKQYQNIQSITAELAYYPLQRSDVSLPIKAGETTQIAAADTFATLTPLPHHKGRFVLRLYQGQNSRLSVDNAPELNSVQIVTGLYRLADTTAPYLSAEQHYALLVAGEQAEAYQIWFTDNKLPDHITLRLLKRAAQPSAHRSVSFLSKAARLHRLDNFLGTQRLLLLHPSYNSMTEGPFDESFNHDSLTMKLDRATQVYCQLAANQPSGEPLRWEQQDTFNFMAKLADQHPTTVTTTLSCPGTPTWQPIDVKTGPYPWLIDVSSLPEFDEKWTAAQLLGHYHFYFKKGGLIAIDMRNKTTQADNQTVGQALLAGKYLRIYGRLDHSEQSIVKGQPFNKTWQTTLTPGS